MRVSVRDTVDSSKSRKYVYAMSGSLLGEYSSGGGWLRDIIYLGGKAVVEVDAKGAHELHCDHLGTPRIMTNGSTGKIEGRQSFGAYGEAMVNTSSDNAYVPLTGYTGHIQTDATGLIYMRARYYSPAWHRFVSGDHGLDPHSPNQFAYVGGSPLEQIDPSGNYSVWMDGAYICENPGSLDASFDDGSGGWGFPGPEPVLSAQTGQVDPDSILSEPAYLAALQLAPIFIPGADDLVPLVPMASLPPDFFDNLDMMTYIAGGKYSSWSEWAIDLGITAIGFGNFAVASQDIQSRISSQPISSDTDSGAAEIAQYNANGVSWAVTSGNAMGQDTLGAVYPVGPTTANPLSPQSLGTGFVTGSVINGGPANQGSGWIGGIIYVWSRHP